MDGGFCCVAIPRPSLNTRIDIPVASKAIPDDARVAVGTRVSQPVGVGLRTRRESVRELAVRVLAAAQRLVIPIFRLAKRWQWAATVCARARRVGRGVHVYGPVYFLGTRNVALGSRGNLYDNVLFETEAEGTITLGDRFTVNRGGLLSSHSCLTIGDNFLMGEYASIRDSDHVFLDCIRPIREQGFDARPIRIGNDVWIGRGAVVLKGVTIGDGAVIGANSVVNRDIPGYQLWAGVPARFIRDRGGSDLP